ncbi:unnamed protein product [Rotaria magnacalcarata]|uniref:Uncharacterized protein n=1 Tax=Rotaria magnacalcarata TaxID=392030 RepID=A0A816D2X8_9BILA|nr:unnamed protein product [Rotaria magnacalcarata]CAF1632856.1 unnamed protein product [Rotaria magnacalcarata]CAF2130527.1 unnamed protein product [Rotaria magnacalcarata]CAF3774957.1 unnamed protein product [Rotaria magnacalcarata]CAF3799939.1 unnamed protein product [Rotaria magnacalcarata]
MISALNNDRICNPWYYWVLYTGFMFIVVGIIVLFRKIYLELQNIKIIIKIFKQQFSSTYRNNVQIKKQKHLTDLSNFIPLRSYKVYTIDQTTSLERLYMLIEKAGKTTKFSFSTYHDDESNKNYFVIDFIQPSSSIIINVEISKISHVLNDKLQELLSIIFYSSNTIYTWNYLSFPPVDFLIYDHIYSMNTDKINPKNFISLQHQFKHWYNRTFKHDENCQQIVDFVDSDGPLCSCPYRPCKFPTDTWSLSMAIMYTFHEHLQLNENPLEQCLAITKLAIIIEEGRNRQQIEALRSPSIHT